MAGEAGREKTPSSAIATVTFATASVFGVAWGGAIFEAADPFGIEPEVGDAVLVDWLPASQGWIIVGTFA